MATEEAEAQLGFHDTLTRKGAMGCRGEGVRKLPKPLVLPALLHRKGALTLKFGNHQPKTDRAENFPDRKRNLTLFCKRRRHEHQLLCVQYTRREESRDIP